MAQPADNLPGDSDENLFATGSPPTRIQELQATFDDPDGYGRKMSWANNTIHDAANILLRFLLQLPQPIIPAELYDRFCKPVRDMLHQTGGAICSENEYPLILAEHQAAIDALVPLDRQLLLYLLDMLAFVCANPNSLTETTTKLAAIFQPAIISHPDRDSVPDLLLAQEVLSLLIINQNSFTTGMVERPLHDTLHDTADPMFDRSTVE